MTNFLKICQDALKAKKGNQKLPDNLYKFVNACRLANDLRKRNVKARYPRKSKKFLADAAAMDNWDKHVREMERAAFTKLHPNGKMPKRLMENRPKNKGKKGKQGHGGGHGGAGADELLYRAAAVILRSGEHGNNQQKKRKGRKPRKAYNPTYEHAPEARFEMLPDDDESGGRNYSRTWQPEKYDPPARDAAPPGGPRRYRFPAPYDSRQSSESRMQRGYFY
jgi:hypothetical protein